MVTIVELGEDRHDLIRAVIPSVGTTGQRQVGYALPLLNEGRTYLVRVTGARAMRVPTREGAIALLRNCSA